MAARPQTPPTGMQRPIMSVRADMTAMSMPVAASARPKIAAAWPVDARTGQTLINGVPAVGWVFVQKNV